MSRKTNTIKALVLAGAVAGSVISIGGSASAATPVITKVGPAKTALEVAAPVTITGTGFDSTIKRVQFGTDTDCAEPAVVMSATTIYTTVPDHTDCSAGLQAVRLLNTSGATLGLAFTGTAGTTGITFVAPVDTSTLTLSKAQGVAGTPFKISVAAAFPAGATATLGGKPLTLAPYTAGGYTTAVPAGLAPGAHAVVVTADTVKSLPSARTLEVMQTVKVAPTSAPVGSAGEIVLTGLGFKPASPATISVTVCGVPATVLNTGTKLITDTKIYVTAPTAAAIAAAGRTGFATSGGACDIKVVTDVNGAAADVAAVEAVEGVAAVEDDPDTAEDETVEAVEAVEGVPAQVNPASVITAGSTFTYAAF